MRLLSFLFVSSALLFTWGCGGKQQSSEKKLPILGRKEVVKKKVKGEVVKDTIPHKIPPYQFVDQDSNKVTPATFKNHIYVADFFFTSCPTICPTMTEQMHRVYKKFEKNPEVMFLSHSIDPKRDTPAALKAYAQKLNIDGDKWRFVTGKKEEIYEVATEGYMASAKKDSTAPGGFLHSGQFFLIDKKRRIRGVYNGTKPKDVDELMKDMEVLLGKDAQS